MGIDIGSTTVKVVLTDSANEIVFSRYRRHFSEIKKTVKEILAEAKEELGYCEFATMITGSGGVALAKAVGVDFRKWLLLLTPLKPLYHRQMLLSNWAAKTRKSFISPAVMWNSV